METVAKIQLMSKMDRLLRMKYTNVWRFWCVVVEVIRDFLTGWPSTSVGVTCYVQTSAPMYEQSP